MADPSLSSKQRALITDAARALDKSKMMRFDEKSGNFYCTELGRIASHFYIQYSSVETYNEMLRRHMNDSEVVDCGLLLFLLDFSIHLFIHTLLFTGFCWFFSVIFPLSLLITALMPCSPKMKVAFFIFLLYSA